MKKLGVVLLCLLTACNSQESRDKKIVEAIFENASKGLDNSKMQKVDSVNLIRIDSLTEKSKIMLELDRTNRILGYQTDWVTHLVESIKSNDESISFNKKYGIDNAFNEKWDKEYNEDLKEKQNEITRLTKSRDSLEAISRKANGSDFIGFRVESNIFYRTMHDIDTVSLYFFIDKDYKIEDTSNTFRKYINFVGGLEKK